MSEPDQVRCFVGVAAADMGLQDALVQQMQQFRQQPGFASIRWTPADFLHLTLSFLGNQPLCRLEALQRQLDSQLGSVSEFALQLERCAGFPDARSRIVAAIPMLSPALQMLQQRVTVAVQAAGIALEARPWRPHITLGRLGGGASLPPLTQVFTAGGPVKAVSLYRSDLLPGGSHYTVIRRWALDESIAGR